MPNQQHKNIISVAEIIDAVTADAQRLKQTAFVCQLHEHLANSLLEQVSKVDFRAMAGFEPNDEDAKLKKPHYLIIIVEQVLELAKINHWGLCRREGFFYSYNGAFWKQLEKDDLKAFLRQAAEKMGVDKFTAQYKDFSKDLFEQFNEMAYLPSPVVNRDSVKINLQNGTFEISSENQQLRHPDAANFLTHQLPFAYDSAATAPQFQVFLNRVLPDTDCQKLLAEYLGYVFISPAKLKLEKTLLLYGSGANGKSVFFEIVTALLGPDNVSHYSLQSLTNEPAYCRAHLSTKLVNYASEINGKLEADTFKQMVSGEPVEARLPYGQPFILTNYAKLIFNCNELPADVEHTPAYFRRFLIIPFNVTIPEQDQDKQLAAKIIDGELSGVFNWILSGLRRLLDQGRFTDADAVQNQVELYKRQSDSVRQFLDENEYKPDPERSTPLKDLYRDYKSFCSEDGYKPVNNRNFQKRLNANGILTNRRKLGYVAYAIKSDVA
jgi:putative DNA primase/helicase